MGQCFSIPKNRQIYLEMVVQYDELRELINDQVEIIHDLQTEIDEINAATESQHDEINARQSLFDRTLKNMEQQNTLRYKHILKKINAMEWTTCTDDTSVTDVP